MTVFRLQASFIAAHQHTTCAVTAAGGVSCWGLNDAGQLGDGSFTNQLVPTAVPGLSSALEVALSDEAACARFAAGVKCWGSNASGELGLGSKLERLTATATAPICP